MVIVSGNALVRPSRLPPKTWVWSKRTRQKQPARNTKTGRSATWKWTCETWPSDAMRCSSVRRLFTFRSDRRRKVQHGAVV
ncbi:hypothetical protein M0657_001259 [Pyricularia oryzae]|uniref:Uncharacterized protein n=2 Tax=Pyricularia oryzae TaxID=318829 RepID=A0AA97NVE7_PYRO3|nr:hypothetical protein OOU_Y34scaffold00624g14 [Pyricularia oryzae Y34]KAI7924418.1 hypothetical protein M9X92_003863 [Pyricularia oryzae]KAI7931305.1 hypothetical protein M0657_001259 [Pyricularia oryzae]